MRISDEDRQRTVEELRRHCAAGRIDVDEYAVRIEQALSATTLEELDAVRADLPMMRIAEPGGHGIWAGGSSGPSLRRPAALGSGPAPAPPEERTGLKPRAAAMGVAIIAVVVVLAAIAVTLAVEWTWAVVLLAGWAAGMLQGRLGRRRGPGR
ncbi:MAG TPA: DUF1707 domain-containing protein [Acidimicrobiales bacterium]|nr:DUF1707 domain-containing protein [Acidimicrobiales bacterium]